MNTTDLKRKIVTLILALMVLATAIVYPIQADATAPQAKNSQAYSETVHKITGAKEKLKTINQPASNQEKPKLLVLGVTGLRFEDIQAQLKYSEYNNLKKFFEHSAIANNIVRSVASATCTADGWLAINTGTRMSDVYRGGNGLCVDLRGTYPSGRVHDWNAYLKSQEVNRYSAQLGTLKQQLQSIKAKAIGPGAAVALAGSDGKVENYSESAGLNSQFSQDINQALQDYDLVVADAGQIRPYQKISARVYGQIEYYIPAARRSLDRQQYHQEKLLKRGGDDYTTTSLYYQSKQMMQRLDTVLGNLSPEQNVILMSVADSGSTPHLQAVAFSGKYFKDQLKTGENLGYIYSGSTKHDALIQNADLHQEIISIFNENVSTPLKMVASNLEAFDNSDLSPQALQKYSGSRFNVVIDSAVHADRIKTVAPIFLVYMITLTLILFVLIGVFLNKYVVEFLNKYTTKYLKFSLTKLVTDLRIWKLLRITAIVVSCIPLAGMAYNVLPWWRYPHQPIGALLIPTLAGLLIALLCSLKPFMRNLLLTVVVVSALNAVALAVDTVTGNHLLLDSVLGSQSTLGARMYGFGNIMFAIFSAACLMFAASICEYIMPSKAQVPNLKVAKKTRTRIAVAAVVFVVMVFAVVVDGAPNMGADFGGPPAIIPAFLFLALILAQVKISWKNTLLIFTVTGLVISGIAVADWLRPVESQTHLGHLVQTVLDGGLLPVILRKLGANVNMLTSPLTAIAVCGVLLMVVIVFQPRLKSSKYADSYRWLINDYSQEHIDSVVRVFKPMIIALAILEFIGGAVNDSGIIIPANAVVFAVPLILTVWLTWMINIKVINRQ